MCVCQHLHFYVCPCVYLHFYECVLYIQWSCEYTTMGKY